TRSARGRAWSSAGWRRSPRPRGGSSRAGASRSPRSGRISPQRSSRRRRSARARTPQRSALPQQLLRPRIRNERPATFLGDDDLVAELHAVVRSDLAEVALHDERGPGFDHRVGVRLRVLRMADARVLLLETDAVDHALVALRHVAVRDLRGFPG